MLPAILATSPSPDVSNRYRFIPTTEYVHALKEQGWTLESAKAPKARKSDPAFGLHALTFRRSGDAHITQSLGGLVPRIHLINSHNGTSTLRLMLGIFRIICGNGLMVSSGEIQKMAVRHDSSAKDTATMLSELFRSDANRSIEMAGRWDSIQLDSDARNTFATKVRDLRFGPDSNVEPSALLMVRREADNANTLWSTFNILQENVIKGGIRFYGMRRASRQISNISKEIELNRSLWKIAEDMETTLAR